MRKHIILAIPLILLSLFLVWHIGTRPLLGARAIQSAEFVPQSALVQSTSGSWIIVDFSAYRGHYTSIAVDSNDLVHISHGHNGNLMYTHQYRVGNDIWWSTQVVTTVTDLGGTSLTLDENDRPYIAYYDDNADDLGWAWLHTDGTWHTEKRSTPGTLDGEHPSAVVRGGVLHTAYLNLTTWNVEYIKIIPGGGWPPVLQTVGGPVNADADISLALRSDGLPRIIYQTKNHELVYAHYDGSAWSLEVVDGDVEHKMGLYNSLALDGINWPYIAYFDATNRHLRYAWKGLLGSWVSRVVDDNLGWLCDVSLALDEAGNPRTLYYHDEGSNVGSLRYAQRRSESWSIETVDGPASSCGMHVSLALDSLGRPHASYYCGHLKYAYRLFTVYLPLVTRGQ